MKPEKNILIAFILNLSFAIFEFIGGIFTGSVAIASDAVHDLGDAISIGVSYFLEKISKKQPDERYTYGYTRFSVLGSIITTFILMFGSIAVILNAINRIAAPTEINYNGMILFAVVGVCVNSGAAFFTRKGGSLNQKAVNLHMLEDVLGWGIVLIGAVIMRFTDFAYIDPIMSIGVAVFILAHSIRNFKKATRLFLEKIPDGMCVGEIEEHLTKIDGILDVHHVHIWSMDGQNNYATMHIVTNSDAHRIKEEVRKELQQHGITHVTLELEAEGEECHAIHCHIDCKPVCFENHHHH